MKVHVSGFENMCEETSIYRLEVGIEKEFFGG